MAVQGKEKRDWSILVCTVIFECSLSENVNDLLQVLEQSASLAQFWFVSDFNQFLPLSGDFSFEMRENDQFLVNFCSRVSIIYQEASYSWYAFA
jgi:hypothetical protein